MYKDIRRKMEALLQEEYSLEELVADKDFPAIIRELRIQQIELKSQLEQERKETQEILSKQAIERKQAELKLQQAQDVAETAHRVKSEFLAHISHELRTPLNGILGYTQILAQDKGLTERQRESVAIMQQSGEHLLTLINDILDLSKIEFGKIAPQLSDFHFLNFLKAIADVFRVRAEEKEVHFVYEPDPNLPMTIWGDEKRLRQVLVNLLGNAVKFTEHGQVIFKVEMRNIELEASQNANLKPLISVRFQVEDTGIGIESNHLEEIFTPFHQVGNQNKHPLGYNAEGTGLGLAVSKRLVEIMGGELKAKSILGQGSVFWVDLDLFGAEEWLELDEHLQIVWLYETKEEVKNVVLPMHYSPLAELTAEKIAVLYEMAMKGDIKGIRDEIAQLRMEQNKELGPFVNELNLLAKRYRVKQIRELLKPFIE